MKKNRLVYLFLICSTFLATSCSDDDDTTIDEGEATSNYFPLAINNTWNMENSGGTEETLSLSSTTTVSGNTYYMSEGAVLGVVIGDDTADTQLGFRKSGATYYAYVSETDFDYSGYDASVDAFEYTYFRDDMEEGESVSNTLSVPGSFDVPSIGTTDLSISVAIETTMLAKDTSLTINGVAYENVIELETVATASVLGQELQSVTSYTYFAAEIGVIKTQSSTDTYEIVSYQLY